LEIPDFVSNLDSGRDAASHAVLRGTRAVVVREKKIVRRLSPT